MADRNLNNVEKYKSRALRELHDIDILLKTEALFLCASRCYYAAFYSMRAVLESIGIKTSSHKQTQVEFRKNFVQPGKIEKRFSKILTELFETRSKADYDIHWVTNKPFVERLARETKEFVKDVLNLL